jgi:hypothetical protein
MAKTYIHQKKTTWIATPSHVLEDYREEVEDDTGKQITDVQNHPKAHLDLRHTPVGYSKYLQHRNTTTISK